MDKKQNNLMFQTLIMSNLLTDLLQDGGLQLHVFEYGAHYYTLFTHLQVTQLPDGHDTTCHTHSLMFRSASGEIRACQ